MNRRRFLQTCLAAGAAPAIVRAASLMRWRATESGLVVPESVVLTADFIDYAVQRGHFEQEYIDMVEVSGKRHRIPGLMRWVPDPPLVYDPEYGGYR